MGFFNPDYKPTGAMQAGMYWARKRQRLARIAANTPLADWTFDPATFDSPNFTDANGNIAVAGGDFSADSIGLLGGLNGANFDGGGQVKSSLSWTPTGAMGIRVYPTDYQDWQGPCGWKSNPALGYCLFDNGGGGSPGAWRFVFNPANTSEVDIIGPAIVQNQWCSLFAQWGWNSLSATWSSHFGLTTRLSERGAFPAWSARSVHSLLGTPATDFGIRLLEA